MYDIFFGSLWDLCSTLFWNFSMLCPAMDYFHTCAGISVGTLNLESYTLQFWVIFSKLFIWFLSSHCVHSFWNSITQHLGLLNWSCNYSLFTLLASSVFVFLPYFGDISSALFSTLYGVFYFVSHSFSFGDLFFFVISLRLSMITFLTFLCFFQICLVNLSLLRLF